MFEATDQTNSQDYYSHILNSVRYGCLLLVIMNLHNLLSLQKDVRGLDFIKDKLGSRMIIIGE